MRSTRLFSVTSIFAAGLVLGGGTAWFAFATVVDAPSAPPSLPSGIALPAWSWRTSSTPPLLEPNEASAAVSAWLAMHASSGTTASFAERANALRALLTRLPADRYPRLLNGLAARATPDLRRLCQIAFEAWIDLDPASAARWAGTLGNQHLDLARLATRAWAAIDPAAAAAWACGLRDQAASEELGAIALTILAGTDPARAVALISSAKDASRDKLLAAVVAVLAKTDPASALRKHGAALWKNGDGFEHLREALVAWARIDPAAAAAWILAQPRQRDSYLRRWLVALLGDKTQRPGVASAIINIPGLPDRYGIAIEMIRDWSAENPKEALAWLNSLNDPRLRAAVLEVSADFPRMDRFENSLHFALAAPEGAGRFEQVQRLLSAWADRDPSAALAWMRAQTDPDVASAARSVSATILAAIARDEPATAVAEWAALPDMKSKQAALMPIVDAWAISDPEAALKWVTAKEVGKAAGVGGVIRTEIFYAWSRKEPEEALRWAEAWAKTRDAADHSRAELYLNALAGYAMEKVDRASAANLYAKIEDASIRTRILTKHVREWLAHDGNAARAWLEANNVLTPD